jgi:hypothetical protein
MRRMTWILGGGIALFINLFPQPDCHASFFDKLIRDPLMNFVSKQAQEEGRGVYVLPIDINSDGLKDVLISSDHVPGFDRFNANYWNIYLKVSGGYKLNVGGIRINDDFIALEDLVTSGTRVVTFIENDKPERDSAREGDGHITWYDPQTFIWHRGISINPEDENFKSIFADNYARKIRKVPQAEITRFYEIDVFPAGRKKDYDNDLIKDEDLKTLPRTDPNSDTTGTLLTYGIILGNHTTSETLQLQAQASGTHKAKRAKAPAAAPKKSAKEKK